MITIVGEYPYYRADRSDWEVDLARLSAEGVDAVSFYVPWRLHERPDGTVDFAGAIVPNADLATFLELLRARGLRAIVKPGPFIHAEVRYGGLPDRLIPDGSDAAPPGPASFGIGFGDSPPLSAGDPVFLREAVAWLECVRDRIVRPNADVVVAVQIGNEGVFSDAAKPTDHPRRPHTSPVGAALAAFSDVFAETAIHRYINVPLPEPGIADHLAYDWWARQVLPLTRIADATGYTAWAGPPTTSDAALARTLLVSPQVDMGCVEENWGHVWTSDLFRSSDVLVHHSVLSLALGSPTLSVYTACAADAMDADLQPTPTDLLAEGLDPAAFSGTYCPAAPVTAGGGDGETIEGLRRLVTLRAALDGTDTAWSIAYDLDIHIDPAATFITWKAAEIVCDLLIHHDVHARVVFEVPSEAPGPRAALRFSAAPTIPKSATGATGAHDDLGIAVRHAGDDSWQPLPLANLSADGVRRATGLPPRSAALAPLAGHRVRWLAADGSGAGVDFLFNRSAERASLDHAGVTVDLPPYGVAVVRSRDGVDGEEL